MLELANKKLELMDQVVFKLIQFLCGYFRCKLAGSWDEQTADSCDNMCDLNHIASKLRCLPSRDAKRRFSFFACSDFKKSSVFLNSFSSLRLQIK